MKSMLSIRAGLAALFMLAVSTTAYGQAPQIPVTGTVTSSSGTPLPGVTVRVQGTNVRTVTNASGKYSLAAPTDGVLTFSFVGQRPVQTTVAGRGTIDITMAQIPYLEEVVVTGYTEQRRGDITGGVHVPADPVVQARTVRHTRYVRHDQLGAVPLDDRKGDRQLRRPARFVKDC